MIREQWKNKKVIMSIIIVVISIIMSMCVSSVLDVKVKQSILEYANSWNADIEQKLWISSDIETDSYSINENTYTSLNEDPKLFVNDINDYVQNIHIYFGQPLQNDLEIQIYYCGNDGNYSADRRVIGTANAGDVDAIFPIGRKASNLRVDIGTQADISFVLDKITVNENAAKTTFGSVFNTILDTMGTSLWFERVKILFIVFGFVCLHFFVSIGKMYDFIFSKRWIIAGLLLLFLVCNKYHGDSLAMYDATVQHGLGSEYVQPVLGEARAIRSDEWVVDTPINLSTRYLDDPYGKYNNIIRGTNTINSNTLNPVTGLNNLVGVVKAGIIKVFGYEYGYSFGWYANIFLTFLLQIELFMILSRKNRLVSTCAAFMVVFSSFYLWWGFPSIICSSSGAIVMAWHFIHEKKWKHKIWFAFGTGIFTTGFVLILYPAWQVPMAYIVLAVLIGLVHESWDEIKKLTRKDWIVIGLTLAFTIALIVGNLWFKKAYLEAITKTEYPGGRIDYGGFSINKLFNYVAGILFPYKDIGNPSENGTCISLYPIPILFSIFLWIKSKSKDWMVAGLLIVGALLSLYTTVGLPPIVAKYTLMTFCTAGRAVDLLGYLTVIMFVLIVSRYSESEKINGKIGIILASVASVWVVFVDNKYNPGYMGKVFLLLCIALFAFIFWTIISNVSKKIQKFGLIAIIMVSIVTGISVRPISKGLDAIDSKPVALEIKQIVKDDKEAVWMAYGGGNVLPSYLVACGAPTINSVNIYPNMELWRKLDPEGVYNEVYNRYAHINLNFIEEDTSMELLQADFFQLNLSYKDFEKTGVKYIVSLVELSDNQFVTFNKLYEEGGCYIYAVDYVMK